MSTVFRDCPPGTVPVRERPFRCFQQRCTAVALNPTTTSTPANSCSSRTDRAVTAATIGVPLASTVTRVTAPAGTISLDRSAKLILERRHRRLRRQRDLLRADHGVRRTRHHVAERVERQTAGRERDGVLDEALFDRRRTNRAAPGGSAARFRRTHSRRRGNPRCTATPVCGRPVPDRPCCTTRPLVQHDRDVAEQAGLGEVMRHLEHSESPLEVDRAQDSPRDVSRPRIERAEWLVEQQHLRPPRQRSRNRDELSLSAAQRFDRPVGKRVDAKPRRQFPRPSSCLAAPYSNVLANGEMRKQVRVLIHDADAVAPRAARASYPRRRARSCPDVARMTPEIVSSSVVLPEPAGPITTPYAALLDVERDVARVESCRPAR